MYQISKQKKLNLGKTQLILNELSAQNYIYIYIYIYCFDIWKSC